MILQTDEEIKNLFFYLWQTRFTKGDVIEAGVYRGGSAEILNLMKGERPLFLYDSFVDNHEGFDDIFNQQNAYEELTALYGDSVKKGRFPDIANHTLISFCHLDMDGEKATREALEYVYPKLNNGGIILCHDYQNPHTKVKEVVDEFVRLKPDKAIPLTGTTQCVIIKA